MQFYFAYGSNMSTPRLQLRIPEARPLGRAFVDGWQLVFNKPGQDGTGKANIARSAGARTWGVIFEIPLSAWDVLDGFEPGYQRTSLLVEPEARAPHDAVAYVFPATTRDASPPAAAYLAHVLAGAAEHELPQHHIAWLSSFRR